MLGAVVRAPIGILHRVRELLLDQLNQNLKHLVLASALKPWV
jgi:hypothetical protein